MIVLRSTLFFILMSTYTVLHATLSFLTAPLPLRQRYWFITRWSKLILWLLKVCCGIHCKVRGQENIPKQPAIIACKHQSAWETLSLQMIFPPQVWLIKKQLLQIPFFGWALRLLEPIAIDRTQRKEAMNQLIQQGREKLSQGRFIVIFPEGTRMPPGESKPFAKGAAVLAVETQTLLVPVAHNAGQFWPRRGFLKTPGTIQLIIGKPFDPQGETVASLNEKLAHWMTETMNVLEDSGS